MSEYLSSEILKDCSICLEQLILNNNCCITQCNHIFHLTCLLKSNIKNNLCPLCRNILYENNDSDTEYSCSEEDISLYDDTYEEYTNHGYEGYDPLILNTINGNIKEVKNLIDNMIDINKIDDTGKTALFWAIMKNQIEIMKVLINFGSNTNLLSLCNNTPLFIAIYERNIDAMNILLKNCDINLKNKKGFTAFHIAVDEEYLEGIDILVKAGIDVNIQSDDGYCGIIMTHNYEIIHYLLKIPNIDLSKRNYHGDTILMTVIVDNYIDLIKIILEKTDDINATNIHGDTALMIASMLNRIQIVDLLLTFKNIDIHMTNKDNKCAFDFAKERNNRIIMEMISSYK